MTTNLEMSSVGTHRIFNVISLRKYRFLDSIFTKLFLQQPVHTECAIAFKCTLAYVRQLCPIYQELTFLHFRALICVERICDAHDIRGLWHLQFYNNLSYIYHVSRAPVVHGISNLYRIPCYIELIQDLSRISNTFSMCDQNFIMLM